MSITEKLEYKLKDCRYLHGINYKNPNRKAKIFYNFVKQSACNLGIELEYHTITPLNCIELNLKGIIRSIKDKDVIYGVFSFIDLFLQTGAGWYIPHHNKSEKLTKIDIYGNGITINIPFSLLACLINTKSHEYYHAYERLLKETYRKEGIEIPRKFMNSPERKGMRGIPSENELIEFERYVIKEILTELQ